MHRVRAELQGERHVGVSVECKGKRTCMSGGLSWWVVRASGMRPTFTVTSVTGRRWVTYNRDENTICSTLMHLAS